MAAALWPLPVAAWRVNASPVDRPRTARLRSPSPRTGVSGTITPSCQSWPSRSYRRETGCSCARTGCTPDNVPVVVIEVVVIEVEGGAVRGSRTGGHPGEQPTVGSWAFGFHVTQVASLSPP